MLRDLLEFLRLGQVLAEPGEDGGDAKFLLRLGSFERVLDALAWHEASDRSPDEPHLVTWSRSHGLVDAASSALRITLIEKGSWASLNLVSACYSVRLKADTRVNEVASRRDVQSTLRMRPPSTCTVAPVMYEAASDKRNAATRPNSSGCP